MVGRRKKAVPSSDWNKIGKDFRVAIAEIPGGSHRG